MNCRRCNTAEGVTHSMVDGQWLCAACRDAIPHDHAYAGDPYCTACTSERLRRES